MRPGQPHKPLHAGLLVRDGWRGGGALMRRGSGLLDHFLLGDSFLVVRIGRAQGAAAAANLVGFCVGGVL